MDDLLQEFIGETREMLAAIASELVAWEADPSDRARLDEIFRFVHTVKGSCGFLDLPRLARLSHAAEDVLGDLRAGRRAPDAALVSAVLGIVDRIGELAEAIETGESLPDADDHRLIAALATGASDPAVARPNLPRAIGSRREPGPRAVSRTVRLPIDLLDRMISGVSDMVLARNELARTLRDARYDAGVDLALERLSTCIADMRDTVMRTRMQRIDTIFAALPRMVRHLSAELGKLVVVEIEGGEVELDREMIEMIRDPLTHIIRNAIDHGIETPEQRRAAGKPEAGRLTIAARQAGNRILIEIADDGRGIDGEKVAARAVSAGIVSPERVARLSWPQKVALVFEPGLSTAETITTISGRGVGMDVVRANVERIGGLVDIESRPRIGLKVSLRVPLTLTIIPALTVTVGALRFALPRAAIDEIVRADGAHAVIERLGDGEMATIRGRRVPVVRLAGVLGLAGGDDDAVPILVVLRPAGGAVYALALDAVHDHEELVVKPAAPAIVAAGIYAGMALPDDGQPMLLLDPAGIAEIAGVPLAEIDAEPAAALREETVPTLLFHDLDGAERAIRLAVVERIEDVPAEAVRPIAGRRRLVQDGRIMTVFDCGGEIKGARATVLRLSDGSTTLGYAIAGVIDIREIDAAIVPAAHAGAMAGRIAGVMLVEGRPVEVIDPYGLFAEAARESVPIAAARPLALLGDADDPWTRDVLRPLVEAAGYRVGFVGAGEQADLVIESGQAVAAGDARVIRLRADAAPDAGHADAGADARHADARPGAMADSIYRYDRDALLAALHAGRGQR